MRVEVIILGPQRQPSYIHDRKFETERWYKVCFGSSHRVGDGFIGLEKYQEAFMCPRNMEVYRGHGFEMIDGEILDKDLVSIEDWIDENCQGLMEILDDDEEDWRDYL